MESKCPACGNDLAFLHNHGFVTAGCTFCAFKCESKDLPRIAAAMELARELAKLEKCERIGPEYHRLEKSIAQMEYHVIKVFGGE